MTRLLIAIALLALTAGSRADDEGSFPGVERLMSPDEFSETGLDKLGPEERQALDKWLIRYTAWEAPAMRANNAEVQEVEKAFELTDTIKQPFNGWSGKTYFYLENGQVWQQRISGRYHYSGDDTAVTFRKNLLGFDVMELQATKKKIGVKRIK
ncbi:MAG: hypothetical protein V7720_10265 [Halioglobus sp.]